MEEFVIERLQSKPTIECKFNVGDVVTYTNDYGVSFEDATVIGFSKPACDMLKSGAFIHLDLESYWMPVEPTSLSFGVPVKVDRDLILNNGQKAIHTGFDFWGLPIYRLECGVSVCSVDNALHTITNEGKPNSPLKLEYQATV